MPTPTAGTPSTLIGGGGYKAFPVGCRCANGDRLIAYITGTDHVTRDDQANLLRSTDGGFTFSADGTVAGMKPSLLVTLTDGTVILGAWDDTAPYSLIRRSTDHGATWAAAVDIPHPFDDYGVVESIAETANGELVAMSYGQDVADTLDSVSQARSTDGGLSWVDEGVIFNGGALSRHMQEPQVLALDTGELLCMLRSDTGTATIYTSRSTDHGATWSGPAAAFAGTGRPSARQAPDGAVLVTYRDNADPAKLRASDDRGATWLAAADYTGGSVLKFEYGAFLPLPTGETGVVYALEASSSDSDIYYVVLGTEPGELGGEGFWQQSSQSSSDGGTSEHNDLEGRDEDDAHPMSAITGLEAALDALDGRWEVVVAGTAPPVAVTTEAEDDWLYTFIPN